MHIMYKVCHTANKFKTTPVLHKGGFIPHSMCFKMLFTKGYQLLHITEVIILPNTLYNFLMHTLLTHIRTVKKI